jgi:hypothetical protein
MRDGRAGLFAAAGLSAEFGRSASPVGSEAINATGRNETTGNPFS